MSTVSETNDRLKELKGALKERTVATKEIGDAFKVLEDGTIEVSNDQKAAFDANMKDIREIRSLISDLEALADGEKYLNTPERESVGFDSAPAPRAESKSLGQMFLDSEEFKSLDNGRASANMQSAWDVDVANIGGMWRKDIYAGAAPSTGDFPWGSVEREGWVDRGRRLNRVRDLFPVQTTTASVIEFIRTGGFTNNAAPVGQRNEGNTNFGLKPQSNLSWSAEQAPVRTIAHWEAAHRDILADEPRLRGMIDNELLYGLRLVEDAQILAGSGTGEELQGILNTPGIQQYAWSDGATTPVPDTKADALRRAATLAFLAYYEPSGVVLHPNDWEDIELTKNLSGDYLLAVSIALGGEKRVWRMPVVDTPAIEEGTALVGAFGLGAQLYDRAQANIRISESHADLFIRNAIVVLAEERVALTVARPESFVEVDLDSAPGS